jgi:hypothetical protein
LNRGVYILANDAALDNAIALVNSIRFYNSTIPVLIIPFDDKCSALVSKLLKHCNVSIFSDFGLLERFTIKLKGIFRGDVFTKESGFRHDMLRKNICWFGPLDQFLYLDADIVVFEDVKNTLDYLGQYDFVCCDYQFKNNLKYVFKPKIIKDEILSEAEASDTFNAGYWASKKNLFSEDFFYEKLEECVTNYNYLDYRYRNTDQPIFNYFILKYIKKRHNIVRGEVMGAGSWAGSGRFIREGNILVDPDVHQPLKYLHWAGIKIKPGCPYWDIWNYYRNLRII